MATYILLDDASGIIVNRIVLDDPSEWDAPAGHSILADTTNPMAIGGTIVDGVYTPPPEPVNVFDILKSQQGQSDAR